MLLLWIGLAIAGGGAATILCGVLLPETPFATSLILGGLILMSFGLLVWMLGLVIRRLGDRPNGGFGNPGMAVASRRASPPLPAPRAAAYSSGRRRHQS